jgi:hypothetical protein
MRRPGPTNARAASQAGYSCEPSVLGPQLTLWLRSSVGVTVASGVVSAWADQSGNGAHFVQATENNKPAYLAGDANFGGYPSIRPGATAAHLATPTSVTVRHCVIVANYPANTFGASLAGLFTNNPEVVFRGQDGSPAWRSHDNLTGTYLRDGVPTTTALVAANRAHIYERVLDAAQVSSTWFIGNDINSLDRPWGGGIAEVITSRTVIPDRTLRGIRQMLRNRYGTP